MTSLSLPPPERGSSRRRSTLICERACDPRGRPRLRLCAGTAGDGRRNLVGSQSSARHVVICSAAGAGCWLRWRERPSAATGRSARSAPRSWLPWSPLPSSARRRCCCSASTGRPADPLCAAAHRRPHQGVGRAGNQPSRHAPAIVTDLEAPVAINAAAGSGRAVSTAARAGRG